jgi:ubiquitin carboxyl-terminal hydrolase 22/27/51
MADGFANGPNPPHRVDASMCDHLRGSLDLDATVKFEPVDGGPDADAQAGAPAPTRSKLEKRFTDVVRWGGVSEGVKRRKVSYSQDVESTLRLTQIRCSLSARQTISPACQSCESPLTRPWACLTCSYVGCMHLDAASSSSKNCMQVHWQQSGENCRYGGFTHSLRTHF